MVIIGTAFSALLVFGFPFLMRRNKDNRLLWVVLAAYVVIILILTLGIRSYDDETTINLKPFNCFERIWFQLSNSFRKYGHKYDLQQLWMMRRGICNILLNIILFIPLGYLVPLSFRKVNRCWKLIVIGFGFTLCIESLQLLAHRGWFDIDDLILNTFGAAFGWILYRRKLYKKDEICHQDNGYYT